MFWPWLDFGFTRQHALEREDLIVFAVGLGLDVDRFIADLDSPPVIERFERDLTGAGSRRPHVNHTLLAEGRRQRGSYDPSRPTVPLATTRRGARHAHGHGGTASEGEEEP